MRVKMMMMTIILEVVADVVPLVTLALILSPSPTEQRSALQVGSSRCSTPSNIGTDSLTFTHGAEVGSAGR